MFEVHALAGRCGGPSRLNIAKHMYFGTKGIRRTRDALDALMMYALLCKEVSNNLTFSDESLFNDVSEVEISTNLILIDIFSHNSQQEKCLTFLRLFVWFSSRI